MENDPVWGILLDIREAQGENTATLRAVQAELERLGHELVRMRVDSEKVETRVVEVERQLSGVRQWAAGVSFAVALIWYAVKEWLSR